MAITANNTATATAVVDRRTGDIQGEQGEPVRLDFADISLTLHCDRHDGSFHPGSFETTGHGASSGTHRSSPSPLSAGSVRVADRQLARVVAAWPDHVPHWPSRCAGQTREMYMEAYLADVDANWTSLSHDEREDIKRHVAGFDHPARVSDYESWCGKSRLPADDAATGGALRETTLGAPQLLFASKFGRCIAMAALSS